jgi:hypothetical protein
MTCTISILSSASSKIKYIDYVSLMLVDQKITLATLPSASGLQDHIC